ncbi:MAG: NERD domain-containing protein [Bacilli bacterium]|nr:NERD domain-containing protein [Bacilli bacterium]
MRLYKYLDNDPSFTGVEGEVLLRKNIPNDCYYKSIRSLFLLDENNYSHQIDQLLIRPNGIFCVEVKNYKGQIYGKEYDEKWVQKIGNETHYFYNPVRQNYVHKKVVEYTLNNKYKVTSLVVFIKNNIRHIDVDNVISLKDFKDYITNYKSETTLSNEDIDEIFKTIAEKAPKDMTMSKHLKR